MLQSPAPPPTTQPPAPCFPPTHQRLCVLSLSLFFFLFGFLGPHPWHTEVPSLGGESELQLLVYITAIATWDPSCVCDLHYSSWQCQNFDPLSEAKDRTASSWIPVGFITTEP